MGTSLEGEKGRDIFNAVSEAAAVMKLSAEQTEGTFLALGQMISKGNVQAEELRGQLGERLPGAFNIFARAIGVSTKQLNKMLQDGEVIAEKTLPLFAAELRRTFSPGVLSASNSFNANMNRFNNFLFRAKIELGNGLLPVINDFISVIPKLDFSPLLFTFQQLKEEVTGVMNVFDELTTQIGVSFSTFDKLTILLRYVSGLFRVAWTPIRIGIHVYTQLITLIKNSFGVFEGLGNIIAGTLTKDFTQIAKGTKQLGDAVGKIREDALAKAGEFLDKEIEGWKKLFAPINDPSQNNSYANGITGDNGGDSSLSTSKDKTSTAGVEKISSGTRNITVNINKLIETVKFEKWNGQNEAQLMEMIKRALVTVVNDVNIVAQ
jgi:tape measure domain